jgi:cytochrome b
VIGLVVTANIGGNWMNWHLRLGYAVLTLLLFRLVWGFVGGHWSQFRTFVYSPAALWRYLRGQGDAGQNIGHSPLGALSVFALLGVLLVQVGTGLVSDDEIAFSGPLTRFVSGDAVATATGYHKNIGKFLVIGLVVLHLAAILFYKLVRKHSLVRPMVSGDKQLPMAANSALDSTRSRLVALGVLLVCAAAVRWLVGLGLFAGY